VGGQRETLLRPIQIRTRTLVSQGGGGIWLGRGVLVGEGELSRRQKRTPRRLKVYRQERWRAKGVVLTSGGKRNAWRDC